MMKIALTALFIVFTLFGCDRYIQKVVIIEPMAAEGDRFGQIKEALNEVDPLAKKYGFERIEVPKEILLDYFNKGLRILAWYDTNSDLETPRGSWMYFTILQELSSRNFVAVFHQFPELSEKQAFTDVRSDVVNLLARKGFRVTLKDGM
ncbi:MAG: hypothetical protein MRJ96_00135 [Nitrospirales bacterium]|nr:hypothetical protein [Nitrospira sp.]MDR4499849.1 hypothetical protein [Nitrospirales bacterium]